MRTTLFCLTVASLGFSSHSFVRGGDALTKANLDLPVQTLASCEEEPAADINFFCGREYVSDCIVFCIDRSDAMRTGGLDFATREVIRTIRGLSESTRFGIVLFDQRLIAWPDANSTTKATPARKAAAINLLAAVGTGRGVCIREGVMTALDMADRSRVDDAAVIYIGSGTSACPGFNAQSYAMQTVVTARERNHGELKIHTVDLSEDSSGVLRCLAEESGGDYNHLPMVGIRAGVGD